MINTCFLIMFIYWKIFAICGRQKKQLIFDDDGVRCVAKWAHLKQLYHFESERLVKLSDLNKISIAPMPIERQWVSACRWVFSKKTYNALLTQSGISVDKNDTALFINKVLTWWKILNVQSIKIHKLCNDPLQAKIRSPNDIQLDFIIEFGKMAAFNMAGSKRNHKKLLSQNTATAIHHTCNGIVSLSWHFLATSHKYVLLGQFSTDPLEKEFVNFVKDQVAPILLMFNKAAY